MENHTFEIHAPKAKRVYLAGSFNDWSPNAAPMLSSKGGDWTLALKLKPGQYEFKFVIDGEWCCEPGCEGPHKGCSKCVPNELGTMNRFVEIR